MKFAIGYQLPEPEAAPFAELVRDYCNEVGEVYFAWPGHASGRAEVASQHGWTDWTAQERLEQDLLACKRLGAKLDLLFNANCYGADAVSTRLANQVASILDHLQERLGGVDVVTTTSPFVAHVIRQFAPDVELRASVNMRLGTPTAMAQMADLFDSYYVQREFNRDDAHLRRLLTWAEANGKQLHLLANSGCLSFCAAQSFHDNLVAHESELDERSNVPDYTPHLCWRRYRDRGNWHEVLQSSWIRPEDLHHYEDRFAQAKLATRMHGNPRMVIDAYTRRRYSGNLLDLLEPGFAPAFAPWLIDNMRFPDDWHQRTSTCGRRCESCNYCADVLEQVLVEMAEAQDAPVDAAGFAV